MHKIILVITVFLLSANIAFSQPVLKNAIFFEVGGNAYYYSINYERQSPGRIIARIGVGYLYDTFVIPLTIGKMYGNKKHHFEISGGVDLAKNSGRSRNVSPEYFVAITGFVGYRYQNPEKKFFPKA